MLWLLIVSTCTSLVVACDAHAPSVQDMRQLIESSPSFSERAATFIVERVLWYSWSRELITHVQAQNAAGLSTSLIAQRDVDWQTNVANGTLSTFQQDFLGSAASLMLRNINTEVGLSSIAEVLVMDNQGALVGSAYLTSDYYQGDEAKWQQSFNNCSGGVVIADRKFDDSTGLWLQQVSLPLIDQENKVIGAMTWGLLESATPCRLPVSLASLEQTIRDSAALSTRLGSYVISELFPRLHGEWEEAARTAPSMTIVEVLNRNVEWKAAVANGTLSDLQQLTLAKPLSMLLAALVDSEHALGEVFLTDSQGALVATSALTPDYWQGIAPQFTEAHNACMGGVHISATEMDASGMMRQRVSMPLLDAFNTVIGVVTIALFEMGTPCVTPAPSMNTQLLQIANGNFSDQIKQLVGFELLLHSYSPFLMLSEQEHREHTHIHTNVSAFLKQVVQDNAPAIRYGVAVSRVGDVFGTTSDSEDLVMNQGMQQWFRTAFNDCEGGVSHDFVELQHERIERVGLPLIDGQNRVVGAVLWAIHNICLQPVLSWQLNSAVASSSLSIRSKAFVLDHIMPDLWIFTQLVKAHNAHIFTMSQILTRDVSWISAVANQSSSNVTLTAFQSELLGNNASLLLRSIVSSKFAAAIGEAFIMGDRGALVGSTGLTMDYWHGDEAKFTDAINGCQGGVSVGTLKYEVSAGMYLQQVSLPLINEANHVIGALVWGLREDGMVCQKPALGANQVKALIEAAQDALIDPLAARLIFDNLLLHSYDSVGLEDSALGLLETLSFPEGELLDSAWIAAVKEGVLNEHQYDLLRNNVSQALRLVQLQIGQHVVAEAFVTDIRGFLLGATALTSDFFQGDEVRFTGAFRDCTGGFNADAIDYEKSTGIALQHVSLPLVNDNNRVVGTITWGILGPSSVEVTASSAIFWVVTVLSVVTNVCIACLSVLTIQYRTSILIRASSHACLQIMLLGAFFNTFVCCMYTWAPSDGVCQARQILLPMSMLVFFAPLVLKSYRIVSIFRLGKKLKKFYFTNLQIIGVTLGLLMLQGVISLAAFAIETPRARVARLVDGYTYSVSRSCTINWPYLFSTVLFIGIILLLGTIIAVQTRKLPSIFNEATHIGICLGFVLFYGMLILPVLLLLNAPTSVLLLRGFGWLACIWICLGAMFGPKLTVMRNKRENEGSIGSSDAQSRSNSGADHSPGAKGNVRLGGISSSAISKPSRGISTFRKKLDPSATNTDDYSTTSRGSTQNNRRNQRTRTASNCLAMAQRPIEMEDELYVVEASQQGTDTDVGVNAMEGCTVPDTYRRVPTGPAPDFTDTARANLVRTPESNSSADIANPLRAQSPEEI